MANRKIFTNQEFQPSALLVNPKVHSITDLSQHSGSVGQLVTYSANLYFHDGSNWFTLIESNYSGNLTGAPNFDPSSGNVPFTVESGSTGRVDNLNADYLDGYDTSTTATSSAIPVYGSGGVLNVGTPTGDTHAATKLYVDNAIQGLDIKPSVAAATTASITLSGNQTIDGVSITAGMRVLVKDQSTASENGIYVSSASAWALAEDSDSQSLSDGAYVFVENGTTQNNTGWTYVNDGAYTWVQFSGAGQITAGDGLTKTGDTLNASVASPLSISNDQITIANGAISGVKLDSGIAGDGLAFSTGVLSVNVSAPLSISADTLTIADGAIGGAKLNTAIAGDGLAISAGVLSVNTTGPISIVNDDLTIADGAITGVKLDSAIAGNGIGFGSGVMSVNVTGPITIVNDLVTIEDGALTGAKLADNTVTSTQLANSITVTDLLVQDVSLATLIVGSTGGAGAELILDGAANGDGSGGDFAYIKMTSGDDLHIVNQQTAGTMLFATGSVTRATIAADGKVKLFQNTGIGGDPSSTYTLYAYGDSKIGGTLETTRLGIGSAPDSAITLLVNGSTQNSEYARLGNNSQRHLRLSSFSVSGNANAGHDINASSSYGQITLSTGSSAVLRADQNKRVSIGDFGTANAGSNLHVWADDTVIASFQRNDSNSGYIVVGNSTTGLFNGSYGGGILLGVDINERGILWNRSNTDLAIGTNNIERLTIYAGGDIKAHNRLAVGGSVNTNYQLYVVGDSMIDGTLVVDSPTLSTEAATKGYVDTALAGASYDNLDAGNGITIVDTTVSVRVDGPLSFTSDGSSDGTLTIADGAIDGSKLSTNVSGDGLSVTSGILSVNVASPISIVNDDITIADGALTGAKLANNTVTSTQLADTIQVSSLGIAGTPSSSYQLDIGGTLAAKIRLYGASSPYIRFAQNTTNSAYIQWNSGASSLLFRNQQNDYFDFRTHDDSGATNIRLQGSDGDVWGSVNASENSGSHAIGFLDGDGHWAIKHVKDTDTQFLINNVEYMRLTSTGLGINITDPLSQLHIEKALSGDASQIRIDNGAGATLRMGITGSGANEHAHIKTNSGENLEFQIGLAADNASPSVVFKSGGNVGIRVADPTATLHINGTSGQGWSRGILLAMDGTDLGYIVPDNEGIKYRTAVSGDHHWFRNSSNTTNLLVTHDGNVAIGSTDPGSYKLNVAGTIYSSSAIYAADVVVSGATPTITLNDTDGNANAATAYVQFQQGGTAIGKVGDIASGRSAMMLYSDSGKALMFFTNGQNATSDTPAITINTSQKVGLGTVSPTYKLHVVGGGARIEDGETSLSPNSTSSSGTSSRALTILNLEDPGWSADALAAYNATTSYDILNRASYSFFARPQNTNIITHCTDVNNTAHLQRFVNLNSSALGPLLEWSFYQYDGSGTSSSDFKVPNQLFHISALGGTKLMIQGDGNVGVGLESPQDKLDVDGTVRCKAPTTSDWGLLSYNSSGNAASGVWYTNSNAMFLARNSSNTLTVRLESAGTSYIDNNSNFGIGTQNPDYKLDVRDGSAATRIVVRNENNAGGGAGIYMRTFNGTTQVSNATVRTNNTGIFSIFNGAGSESENFSISAAGDVQVHNKLGVGTSNPGSYKLYVNGDSLFSNDVSIGNDITIGRNIGVGTGSKSTSIFGYYPLQQLVNTNPLNQGWFYDAAMYREVYIYKYDGSSWTSTLNSAIHSPQRNHAYGGGYTIPNGTQEVVIYYGQAFGYAYLSSMTMMHSTQGNSATVYIETSASGTTNPYDSGWTNRFTGTFASWPGMSLFQFNYYVGGSHDNYIRVRIVPTWNNSNNSISVYRVGFMTSYGGTQAGTPMSFYSDRRVSVNVGLGVGADPGSYKLLVNGLSRLGNTDYGTSQVLSVAPGNIDFDAPGSVGGRLKISSSGYVFNEIGASVDFRVEGDTDPNLLFLDGSANRMGIGTDFPLQKLHVNGSILLDGVTNGYQQSATRAIGYGSNSGGVSVDGFSGMDIQSVNAPSPYAGNYSQNLRFFTHHWGAQTGGSPRMFIQYDGNIGVATQAPTEKLHVNGNIKADNLELGSRLWYTNTVQDGGAGVANATIIKWKEDTTVLSIYHHYIVQLTTNGTGTDTGACYVVWYDGNNGTWEARYVSRAGSSSNHPLLTIAGTNNNEMAVYDAHTTQYTVRYTVETHYVGDEDGMRHALGPYYMWQRAGSQLRYDDGYVGLGIAPTSKLHLKASGADNVTQGLAVEDTAGRTIRIYGTGSGGQQKIESYGTTNAFAIGSVSAGALVLKTNDTTAVTIDGSNQNVGIGVAPNTNYKLYVNGNSLVTGNLYIGDNNRYFQASSNGVELKTAYGYIFLGPNNSSYAHIQTDRDKFYFNKPLILDTGSIQSYDEDLALNAGHISTNKKILFQSGGASYAAMDTTGHWGLGTVSPYTTNGIQLDVRGNIHFSGATLISGGGTSTTNIDHIWHNDAAAGGAGGTWNFCSDTTLNAAGNSRVAAAHFYASNAAHTSIFAGNVSINNTGVGSTPLNVYAGSGERIRFYRSANADLSIAFGTSNADIYGQGSIGFRANGSTVNSLTITSSEITLNENVSATGDVDVAGTLDVSAISVNGTTTANRYLGTNSSGTLEWKTASSNPYITNISMGGFVVSQNRDWVNVNTTLTYNNGSTISDSATIVMTTLNCPDDCATGS